MHDVSADVAVIGLGAVGSALAFHLAQRGAKVVGIDRFEPPHDRGSSHGLTRITRLAVGEGEAFIPLVKRSHALWRDLEERTGAELYRRTGGLVISSDAADARSYHGKPRFLAWTVELARKFGIAHEVLDAASVRARFPMFSLRDDERAYFEPDAGLLFPERCVAAHLAEAGRLGAVLRMNEEVLDWRTIGERVVVRTSKGSASAARVVVTAGAWLPGLADAALRDRLRVLRQVLYWFRCDEPALYAPTRCPVYIWVHGGGSTHSMYGFPMGDGVEGAKIATEQYEVESDPDRVDRIVSQAEIEAMFETHVRGRLRGLTLPAVRTATCLYTSTADGTFMIRTDPSAPQVTMASACSGHGFKHSAALGEALALHALGLESAIDLAPFSAN